MLTVSSLPLGDVLPLQPPPKGVLSGGNIRGSAPNIHRTSRFKYIRLNYIIIFATPSMPEPQNKTDFSTDYHKIVAIISHLITKQLSQTSHTSHTSQTSHIATSKVLRTNQPNDFTVIPQGCDKNVIAFMFLCSFFVCFPQSSQRTNTSPHPAHWQTNAEHPQRAYAHLARFATRATPSGDTYVATMFRKMRRFAVI